MSKNIEIRELIAARIKNSFKELRISQREAAEKAGVPHKSLERWVRGLSIPRADQLVALAKIGINPNYILLGEGPPILAGGVKKNFPPRKNDVFGRSFRNLSSL